MTHIVCLQQLDCVSVGISRVSRADQLKGDGEVFRGGACAKVTFLFRLVNGRELLRIVVVIDRNFICIQ